MRCFICVANGAAYSTSISWAKTNGPKNSSMHDATRCSKAGAIAHLSLKPVSSRFGEEFFQNDALSAHEQLSLGLKKTDKSVHAGKHFAATAAFHFDGHGRFPLLQNEVHFMVPLAPIGDADVRSETGIDQM